jgi:DNA-binding NarL/FixJ family response regulator
MNALLRDPQSAPRRGRRRLSVLIADQDGLAREMMRTALCEANPDLDVHTARDAREALQLARRHQPTVVITETALPPHGAVRLIRRLLRLAAQTKILTVSVDDEETAIAALRAGAVGHIPKDTDPAELAVSVERAADGEAIVPQALLMPLIERLREVPEAGWRPINSRLTTREWEIVEMLADGASTQSIAERFVLSSATVYSHIKSLLRKLGVHTRDEAIAAARRLRREEVIEQKTDHDSTMAT